jgi:hypothetical protein
VTLGASITAASTGASSTGNAVYFSSTVNGLQALVVNAGVGLITFNGVVGATAPLASLDATSTHTTGVLLGGNVTTVGAQNYNGNVTLNASVALTTTNSNVLITGVVDTTLISSNASVSLYSSTTATGLLGTFTGAGDYDYGVGFPTGINDLTNSIILTAGSVTLYDGYIGSSNVTFSTPGTYNLVTYGFSGIVSAFVFSGVCRFRVHHIRVDNWCN